MSAYSIATRGLAGRKIPQGVLAAINTLLFGASEPGAWYDPSDPSTLFQDSAGTTPVTAVEQPVGLMLDKSGIGNHASQATSTKRPKYSRRVNLLTKTEQFSDAVWVVNTLGGANCTKAANATVAPNGTLTADLITSTGLVNDFIYQTSPFAAGSAVTLSLYVKNNNSASMSVMARTAVTSLAATIAWTGSVLSSITLTTGTSASFVDVGSGWYRVSLSFTTGEENQFLRIFPGNGYSVYLWGASLTLATDAHLPYQWVNTATDYDADPNKFPAFGVSDGVDDSLSCATGGGGTAGFFFSACVSRMAATNGVLFSDIALAPPYNGYYVRISAGGNAVFAAYVNNVATQVVGPILQLGAPSIIQAWDDGTNLNVKVDANSAFSTPRPAMAAGSSGFTMGQDNGVAAGYFNGRVYSTVYRKDSAPTQSQREAVATYQRTKARMP